MGSGGIDVLRSLVRATADRAGRRLRSSPRVAALRRALEEVRRKRVTLSEDALSTAIAHAPGVAAGSVAVGGGRIRIDASYGPGDALQVTLEPGPVRFAPGGAKEVTFRITPAEHAHQSRTADLVSAVSGAVAHALWAVVLPRTGPDVAGAPVEREGPDRLRVDLRSVPAVRRLQARGGLALLIDAFEVGALEADDGILAIEVRLPQLFV